MATSAPLMKTSMELQIPITLIKPSLDEIQSSFSQVLNNILDTHKGIVMWGQRDGKKKKAANLTFASDGKIIILNMSFGYILLFYFRNFQKLF